MSQIPMRHVLMSQTPTLRPRLSFLSCLLLATSLPLLAQTAAAPARGPDNYTRATIPGVEVLPYPSLPFSATDFLVRTRPLTTGGTVTTYEASKVFRDSQGRVYRERHHFEPQGVDPAKGLYEFYILDPVAHTYTSCILAAQHCETYSFFPRLSFPVPPVGPFDNGKQFLARETLGDQTIDGLLATGTRETTTISAQAVGNDQPLTLTREFWYSPDLKTNLTVTRTDPREGTVAVHLQVLSRSDPDPNVFTIPSTFTVHDARPPAQAIR